MCHIHTCTEVIFIRVWRLVLYFNGIQQKSIHCWWSVNAKNAVSSKTHYDKAPVYRSLLRAARPGEAIIELAFEAPIAPPGMPDLCNVRAFKGMRSEYELYINLNVACLLNSSSTDEQSSWT
jgi:hypothetical protein